MSNADGRRLSGAVPLSDAITSLRSELVRAWNEPGRQQLWFKTGPVELTLQVAVTSAASGNAGVKWWVLEAGGDYSRETVATQTVKLSLQPVLFDRDGNEREFLIDAEVADHAGIEVTDSDLDAAT